MLHVEDLHPRGVLSALHQVSAVVSGASTLRPLYLCKLCLDDPPCIHMWKHAAHFHGRHSA